MNLRIKILAYVIAVMAILFVMVTAVITPGMLYQPSTKVASGIEATEALRVLFENLTSQQRKRLAESTTRPFSDQNILEGFLLVSTDGKVFFWGMPDTEREIVSADYIPSQHFDQMQAVLTPEGDRLRLFARSKSHALKSGMDWFALFVTMSLGTLLLSLVIYGLMLRLVIRPVERLAAASRSAAAARGLLAPVPHTERKDEIGELVRAYNKMANEVNDLRLNLEKRVAEQTRNLEAAQQQIVVSERLSVAGRMAAGIAHEINNPLGGMINAARTLRSRAAESTKESEYLELILEGLSRIQGIMSSMLQFSRPVQQAGRVDLREVIDGALMFCRHRFGKMDLKLENNFGDENHYVYGHRAELGQVFLNLFVNALDAMESRGSGPHTLALTLTREGEQVCVRVSDTGTGMAPEVKERAGQFFFSTKAEGKGTGLGLAVVQHIIMQHHGSVKIESKENEGTTVNIMLPLESQPQDAKSKVA
jgi:signal transduction histidine kinase